MQLQLRFGWDSYQVCCGIQRYRHEVPLSYIGQVAYRAEGNESPASERVLPRARDECLVSMLLESTLGSSRPLVSTGFMFHLLGYVAVGFAYGRCRGLVLG